MVVMMVVTMVVIVVMVMTMLMIMNLLLSVSMRMLVAVIVMMGHKASFGSIGCVSFNRIRSRIDFISPVIRRFPVKKYRTPGKNYEL